MSIPRNTDVKKHLARSVPRFVTQEKDSDKPVPIRVEPEAAVGHPLAEKATLKSETP
jgi:hypothetical protein